MNARKGETLRAMAERPIPGEGFDPAGIELVGASAHPRTMLPGVPAECPAEAA